MRLVVELHQSLRHHEWVVVRQRDNAGPEFDPRRSFRQRGEEDLRTANNFPTRRVVLPTPELVEPELVEMHTERQIALQEMREVLPDGMVRREERAESHA